MQRVSKGYTIIEVMIFLAISAVLLGAAIKMLSGRQEQVQYNQKMRDFQSQINSWINDVSNGFSGGDPSSQNCTLDSSNHPVVTHPSSGSTGNNCIFLGKAIQFTDQSDSSSQDDQVYAYSVFGSRTTDGTQSGPLPDNLVHANPWPIVGSASGNGSNVDLTQVYSLDPAYVKDVCTNNGTKCSNIGISVSHLIGFFSSFNTDQSTAANGNIELDADQFNFFGTPPQPANNVGGSTALKCLQLTAPSGCNPPKPLTDLEICLTDGHSTTKLTISSVAGVSPTTKLDYVAC